MIAIRTVPDPTRLLYMTEEPRSSRAASLGYRWTHQPATACWRESLPSLMMSINPLKARSGNQKRGRLGGRWVLIPCGWKHSA
jgi:hypothetical protein